MVRPGEKSLNGLGAELGDKLVIHAGKWLEWWLSLPNKMCLCKSEADTGKSDNSVLHCVKSRNFTILKEVLLIKMAND